MAIDFKTLQAFGVDVRECENRKGFCEVEGPNGVKNYVETDKLVQAEFSLTSILATGTNTQASAARFARNASTKLTESSENFANWVVDVFVKAVGEPVASSALGEFLRPSLAKLIPDNNGGAKV